MKYNGIKYKKMSHKIVALLISKYSEVLSVALNNVGRKITLENPKNGASVTIEVVDSIAFCTFTNRDGEDIRCYLSLEA